MTSRIPIAVIKGSLQGRILSLVRELLPKGRRQANRWACASVQDPGGNRAAFVVWLAGGATGAWKDYKTGDKGDVLDLIAHVRGGGRKDAIAWAKDWLGLAVVDTATLERMRRDAEARKREAERIVAASDAHKISRAFQMWLDASPDLAGTPVETYLATRGIPLAEVPNLEIGEIRYAPRLEWWKGARRDGAGRKIASGPIFPAMVCAVRQRRGELTAVHCTFLAPAAPDAPAGRGKAPVDSPKLMYGLVTGGVIRLTRGPSNLTPEAARLEGIAGPLALGEGVEDGLTIGLAVPEVRSWAATSLGNLGNIRLDDPCVSSAIVLQDNDWSSPQAARAFEGAMARLGAFGKDVVPIRSHAGKDFNDLIRGDEDE